MEVTKKVFEVLKGRGRASIQELLESVGLERRRTLFRVLESFEAIGLVRRADRGVYEWAAYKKEELKLLVEHSHVLKHSALYLRRPYGLSHPEREQGLKYLLEFLDHLRSGYPKLYDFYEESEKLEAEKVRLESEFFDMIERKVEDEFPTKEWTIYKGCFAALVLEELKHRLLGYEPRDISVKSVLVKAKNEEREARCLHYILARSIPSGEVERINEFVEKAVSDLENVRRCEEIVKVEDRHNEARQELEKGLDDIIKMIENNVPLRGLCNICKSFPRVEG